MTARSYQHEFSDRSLRDYRIKMVDGYAIGGSERYAAIWEAKPTARTGRYCKNGECFDLHRLADQIEERLAGRVVKYGFEVRRGVSVVRRASGPKRTTDDPPAADFTVFDRFNPASVSKAVTAVAMLQLLDKNGVSIDTPIYTYLPPDWNIPDNNQSITFKEVLDYSSGLRKEDAGRGLIRYANMKQLMEHEITLSEKVRSYEFSGNVSYALLRVLVASLDGYRDWNNNPASGTAARFISYVNRKVFNPIGIYDVKYKAARWAPTLFYPDPPSDEPGTTYGDYSLRPGSAGSFVSVHELALFGAAMFKGWLLPASRVQELKDDLLLVGDYGTLPDGSRCWGKAGYYPGYENRPQLSSTLVHCDNDVTVMLVLNGGTKTRKVSAKNTTRAALRDAFVAR